VKLLVHREKCESKSGLGVQATCTFRPVPLCAIAAAGLITVLSGATPVAADAAIDAAVSAQKKLFLDSTKLQLVSTQTPLWANTLRANTEIKTAGDRSLRDQSIRTLVTTNGALSGLWDWRQTFRGQGKHSLRQFSLLSSGTDGKGGLRLGIGAHKLPTLELAGVGGSLPAAGLTFGRFSFGSTAPLSTINKSMQRFDALMDGKPRQAGPLAFNESRLMWINVRPLQSKTSFLDLSMVRGRRDLTPGLASSKQFLSGSMLGARGETILPSLFLKKAKLRGEWVKSSISGQAQDATALNLRLDGPIEHPWGKATLAASYSDIEDGFQSFAGATPETGRLNTQLTLTQPIKYGKSVTGTAKLNWVGIERQGAVLQTLAPGAARESKAFEGVLSGRWQFSKRLALTGTHTRRDLKQQMSAVTTFAASQSQHSDTNVGIDMKLTKTLSLAVASGITRAGDDVLWLNSDAFSPLSLRDEDRMTASLKRKTKNGSWSLCLDRKSIDDPIKHTIDSEAETVGLEAEQKVFSWLRLKGSWKLAGQDEAVQQLTDTSAQYSTTAQFSFKKMGRLDVRYSDWDRLAGTRTALGLSENKSEYGFRYTMGSTPDKQGFGVALEYSKQVASRVDDITLWRIGVTYR